MWTLNSLVNLQTTLRLSTLPSLKKIDKDFKICIQFQFALIDGRYLLINIYKSRVLQDGTTNKRFDYEMSGVKLKNIQCFMDQGVKLHQI